MHLEIISLIYKSPAYLKHICAEMRAAIPKGYEDQVSCRVVANDPHQEVLEALPDCGVPYSIYHDPYPHEYYLNRVYRAWNYAGKTSKAKLVVFVNSDMAFHDDWLYGLIECHNIFSGRAIPCSLLIESGNLRSAWPAVSFDAGKTLETFDRASFTSVAKMTSPRILYRGGLFMPCLLPQILFDPNHQDYFPYPEGNMYEGGVGAHGTKFVESGDSWYFRMLQKKYGLEHITTSSSVAYHLQEGEMRCT